MYIPWFAYHSSVDGDLFPLLVIVNHAAMNMHVQVFEYLLSILLGVRIFFLLECGEKVFEGFDKRGMN